MSDSKNHPAPPPGAVRRAGRVLLRYGWVVLGGALGCIALANAAPVLLVFAAMGFVTMGVFVCAYELIASRSLKRAVGLLFAISVFIPMYFAALMVPWRALVLLAREVAPGLRGLVLDIAVEPGTVLNGIDVLGAGAAVLLLGFLLLRNLERLQRMRRQVGNLPTSKARSAALGLSEFQGVARPAKGAPLPPSDAKGPHPFYLEDETGRILVDPREAVAAAQFSRVLVSQDFCEVRPEGGPSPGADVYVLGTVEMNPVAPRDAVGPDALVVRRAVRPLSWWERQTRRIGSALGEGWKDYTYRDVFFISDTTEADARWILMRSAWRSLRWTAPLLALCLWLLVTRAAWLQSHAGEIRRDLSLWAAFREVEGASWDRRLPLLLERVSDPDPEVRARAVDWMRARDEPAATAALLAACNDPDERVRMRALESLVYPKRNEKPEAISAVLDSLGDPSPRVARHAADVLGEYWKYMSTSWYRAENPIKSLDSRHRSAQAGLVRGLGSADPTVRALAANALGKIGPEPGAAVPALVAALQDPVPRVRENAVRALRAFGADARGAVPRLRQSVEDANPDVRREAVSALAVIPPPAESIVLLTDLLKHRVPDVRKAAAYALGNKGPKAAAAAPALALAAADDEVDVRLAAVVALREVGAAAVPEAVPVLVKALQDADRGVRREAARALGEIGPAAREAVPALEALVKGETDETVRGRATEALKKIRP